MCHGYVNVTYTRRNGSLCAWTSSSSSPPSRRAPGRCSSSSGTGSPGPGRDLATLTGQARSTIAARVDLLLSSGLVAPAGEASSTGGRPPATFAFNPAARVVLAVDLGATHSRLALTDLVGTVLAEHHEPIAISEGPVPVLDRVVEVGLDLLGTAGRPISDLVSVGVGLPGPVEHSTGRPINPPIMPGWDDADVPALLSRKLRVPVLVDNDVNVMALGEHTSQWPEVDHLLFVKVATGIGAGIISDGHIRRGAQGAAGDLGHIAVPGGLDLPCRCGNTGCLEAVASGPAIASALQQRRRPAPTSSRWSARATSTPAARSARPAGTSARCSPRA